MVVAEAVVGGSKVAVVGLVAGERTATRLGAIWVSAPSASARDRHAFSRVSNNNGTLGRTTGNNSKCNTVLRLIFVQIGKLWRR